MGRATIVIVTGDTHLPRFGRRLPAALADGVRGADLVLHCGDLTEPFVFDLLAELAPVEAVAGNNDGPELRERLGLRRVVEVAAVRIGLTHGHTGLGRRTPDRALAAFAGQPVDAIAFGHSHLPGIDRRGELWLLNPGSPTDKRRQPFYSYLRLEIAGGRIRPAIIEFGPASR